MGLTKKKNGRRRYFGEKTERVCGFLRMNVCRIYYLCL